MSNNAISLVDKSTKIHTKHHSRGSTIAKRLEHRNQRQSWRQRARELILAVADGEFAAAYRQYDGYTD